MAKQVRIPMPGPIGPMPYPYQDVVTVEVMTDTVSRDEPEERLYEGITMIEVTSNGDLLLWGSQGLTFPSYGWTSGAWLAYTVKEKLMPLRDGGLRASEKE